MTLEYLLPIGMVMLGLGLYGVATIWPKGGLSRTFSQHAAQSRVATIYYIILFTVTLPIFAAYFYGWFVYEYWPSSLFGYTLALALMTQYACTFIPEKGKRARAHRLLALVSALSLFGSLVLLVGSGTFGLFDRTVLTIGGVIMGTFLYMLLSTRAKHSKILLVQAGYFAAFFLAILIVS